MKQIMNFWLNKSKNGKKKNTQQIKFFSLKILYALNANTQITSLKSLLSILLSFTKYNFILYKAKKIGHSVRIKLISNGLVI